MRKNRTILFALLIPLLLDLLVIFTAAPMKTRSESICFEERSEEIVSFAREMEEEIEDEEEFLFDGLPPRQLACFRSCAYSKRSLFTFSQHPASQPVGWSMPLLI